MSLDDPKESTRIGNPDQDAEVPDFAAFMKKQEKLNQKMQKDLESYKYRALTAESELKKLKRARGSQEKESIVDLTARSNRHLNEDSPPSPKKTNSTTGSGWFDEYKINNVSSLNTSSKYLDVNGQKGYNALAFRHKRFYEI